MNLKAWIYITTNGKTKRKTTIIGVIQQVNSNYLKVVRIIQKQGKLKSRCVCFLVNNCLTGNDRKYFCSELRLKTKNGFTTVMQDTGNQANIPDVLSCQGILITPRYLAGPAKLSVLWNVKINCNSTKDVKFYPYS